MKALRGLNPTFHSWTLDTILSVPFFGIWIFWLLGDWRLMIVSIVLSVPIYVRMQARKTEPSSSKGSLFTLFVYCLLLLYAYARVFEQFGVVDHGVLVNSLSTSLYLSVVTWTTLGYGDVTPVATDRLWAASEALLGYVYMALLIAILVPVLTRPVPKGKKKREKWGQVLT